jgi:hypothetical protein
MEDFVDIPAVYPISSAEQCVAEEAIAHQASAGQDFSADPAAARRGRWDGLRADD